MHGLEIGSAGQVAFASRAKPAWHLLGTVFDEADKVDTAEMLKRAHLAGWNVRLRELSNDAFPTQEHFEVLRDNPFEVDDDGNPRLDRLAIVGGRYKVVQNEAAFTFADNILDGGGRWETAGSINDGRRVFGTLELSKDIKVGGVDLIKTYLVISTSHDGTTGVRADITPVRPECQNTLAMAISGSKQNFKIRHTSTVDEKVAMAREALGLAFDYMDAFQVEADKMYATAMNNAQFQKVITDLFPKPEEEKKGALTRWENKQALLGDIFAGAALNGDAPDTTANIRGTAWAGLNAVTEMIDWYRTARDDDPTSLAEAATGFVPTVQAEKQRIWSRFADFVEENNKVLVTV